VADLSTSAHDCAGSLWYPIGLDTAEHRVTSHPSRGPATSRPEWAAPDRSVPARWMLSTVEATARKSTRRAPSRGTRSVPFTMCRPGVSLPTWDDAAHARRLLAAIWSGQNAQLAGQRQQPASECLRAVDTM